MNKIEQAVAAMEEIKMMPGDNGNLMDKMWRGGKGELFILKYLSSKDSAVTPSEISDAMRASTARISAALGTLEKKRQIHREIDLANRRNILVTITEEGRERSRSEMLRMREQMAKIFAEMGEQDAAEFVRLLKRFFEITNRVFDNKSPRE
ncbi:MAG: transcriptional regulator [Clostridiales bacterium]|nr:transcriptional regulator [Clostridiales bacterium]